MLVKNAQFFMQPIMKLFELVRIYKIGIFGQLRELFRFKRLILFCAVVACVNIAH